MFKLLSGNLSDYDPDDLIPLNLLRTKEIATNKSYLPRYFEHSDTNKIDGEIHTY